ncbi:MAG: hypothetical protein QXP16_06180 [Candidatus Bathyarchaeia archaeon]
MQPYCCASNNQCYQYQNTCEGACPSVVQTSLSQSAYPSSPQPQGTTVIFLCDYTANNQDVTGATCYVYIDGTAHSTTYGQYVSSGYYAYGYSTSSLSAGTHSWYCSCSKSGYQSQTGSTESYTITQPQCSGSVVLNIGETSYLQESTVTVDVTNLTNCNGKIAYVKRVDTGDIACSCTISGPGCSCEFTSPSYPGIFYYSAYVDKNGDGDYNDVGEISSPVEIYVTICKRCYFENWGNCWVQMKKALPNYGTDCSDIEWYDFVAQGSLVCGIGASQEPHYHPGGAAWSWCLTTETMWKRINCGSWPSGGSEGEVCKVWWYTLFIGWQSREGRWDPDDNTCIVFCDGRKESTVSNARDNCPGSSPGEGTCEEACGADPGCDELLGNSRPTYNVYCDLDCRLWTVTISADKTNPFVTESITITATSSYPVEQNSYSIVIYSNGTEVKRCTSGKTCSYEVFSISPTTLIYQAKILSGNEVKAYSSEVSVTWMERMGCYSDEDCKDASGNWRYDPVNHTKIVCDCPSASCSYPPGEGKKDDYTCKPLPKCDVNEQCAPGWCCDKEIGYDGNCVKGIHPANSMYLCDPPEWNSGEVSKKKSLLELILSFNPFS